MQFDIIDIFTQFFLRLEVLHNTAYNMQLGVTVKTKVYSPRAAISDGCWWCAWNFARNQWTLGLRLSKRVSSCLRFWLVFLELQVSNSVVVFRSQRSPEDLHESETVQNGTGIQHDVTVIGRAFLIMMRKGMPNEYTVADSLRGRARRYWRDLAAKPVHRNAVQHSQEVERIVESLWTNLGPQEKAQETLTTALKSSNQ